MSTRTGRKVLELAGDARLRLANGVMASATTVRIDGGATAVPAVQLESAGVLADGDRVSLLQSPGDVLIIGKTAAPSA